MEQPPILPDDHADTALDGWEPFESRRQTAPWHLHDLVGALACVIVAVLIAAVTL